MTHEGSSMKQWFRNILLGTSLLASVTLAPAQEANPAPQSSDRQAQRQAERERKEEERRRRNEEKEARQRQGVKCARLRRTS